MPAVRSYYFLRLSSLALDYNEGSAIHLTIQGLYEPVFDQAPCGEPVLGRPAVPSTLVWQVVAAAADLPIFP